MSTFPPAPTYAQPIESSSVTGKPTFSPLWLQWFLDVARYFSSLGLGGAAVDHNALTGLQGGTLTERYHLSASELAVALAVIPMVQQALNLAGAAMLASEGGSDGDPGSPGSRGADGAAGSTGPAGPPGFGVDGEDGVDGWPIPGPQGSTGSTGATGPSGPTGLTYVYAEEGDEGLPGPPGPAGSAGSAGTTGAQGPVGPALFLEAPDGEDGQPGPPGAAGVAGATGAAGPQGPSGLAIFMLGEAGEDGEPGVMGPRGATGPAGSGGGGSANVGTATLDFGAFPGGSDASVAVTGQAAILAGSTVQAWLSPAATADHTADEHIAETLVVFAGNISAGTGFTIYGRNTSQLNEPVVNPQSANWIQSSTGGTAILVKNAQPGKLAYGGGIGTRIYGTWNVAWSWS